MRTLQDFRDEYGENFPTEDEMAVAATTVNLAVESVFTGQDLRPLTGRFVRAARLDLASRAMTQADGYRRTVTTFKDLSRAELNYFVAWVNTVNVPGEMRQLGWTQQGPTPARARRLADQDHDIPPRTLKALRQKYIPETMVAR